jgi:hypothetical protein
MEERKEVYQMLHSTKATPFETYGAKWELLTFEEIPDNVFIRMLEPGTLLSFDGRLRPVRFRPNHGKLFPCFYMKRNGRSCTINIPINEWREHNETSGS